MLPFWPVIAIMTWINHCLMPLLTTPYMRADRFVYDGLINELWLARATGYQYLLPWRWLRRRIARNIADMVQAADEAGIRVVGLGALNKAECINRWGSLRKLCARARGLQML